MAIKNKTRFISIPTQARFLKESFPDSKISTYMGTRLEWVGYLTPTPFSRSYKVKIDYLLGKSPDIYILEPKKLRMPAGERVLKHVYNQKTQQLCLFYPDGIQWNRGRLLSDTILMWASEWLFFYEIWLETGEWKGGGTSH
ncbi:hypothetical protein NYQ10_20690 [Flavobacterium johnsoniae]|uniref:hypothetical protein n=1 Tax=Flavobacterium TaxID=237 RepID=UPI0015BEEF76|nr:MULTISPECIES: hypothetical protein [Flavobacterium]NWL02857.1 hypothetical protein [Flavobacterium collinsii]WET04016.1 hypothetical protein P0R33_06660 [Flavobacterium sp. YJ01]WJS94503.1 hypothetical protein NYQ10_20690 [Flavobacterium johnsoniae]